MESSTSFSTLLAGHVIVDLIAYKDDKIMNQLYMKELMREDLPDDSFHIAGEVRRYVFPLNPKEGT